jgi:hypothetical protein
MKTYIAHCNETFVKEENDSQEGEEYSKARQA